MRCGAPCAGNANMAFVFKQRVGVDSDKHRYQTHRANNVPTLLTINDAIWQNDVQRIIPNLLGKRERDAVLNEIRRGLDCVSLKRHEHPCIGINVFTHVHRALQAANSTNEPLFEIARFD